MLQANMDHADCVPMEPCKFAGDGHPFDNRGMQKQGSEIVID